MGCTSSATAGKVTTAVIIALSAVLYGVVGYLADRADFAGIFIPYLLLFAGYGLLLRSGMRLRWLLAMAVLLRLVFLLALPNLSDDFYRFIWDGLLLKSGHNPFAYLPSTLMDHSAIDVSGIDEALYQQLNSPNYYTVYPPVCQFIFFLSALVPGDPILAPVVVMRLFIVAAEAGSLILMVLLLRRLQLPARRVLLYAFNPLVIIELSGNLHFEALMIFFLLLSIHTLFVRRWALSALYFALAVASKVIPLVMLPMYARRLGWRRAVLFWLLTGLCTLLIFAPLLDASFVRGFGSSASLYFQKFEFNASVFYIVRAIGFWYVGWDVIQTAGLVLALLVFVFIVLLAIFQNTAEHNLPGILLWPLFIYLLFATIVHPWYVSPLVGLCIFSRYRFPVVWSFFIFLSYQGYGEHFFQENYGLVALEYVVTFGYMLYELWKYNDLTDVREAMAFLQRSAFGMLGRR
jgi:hypothetical protein